LFTSFSAYKSFSRICYVSDFSSAVETLTVSLCGWLSAYEWVFLGWCLIFLRFFFNGVDFSGGDMDVVFSPHG